MAKILISPGKYVQGAGEMKKLYDYAKVYGKKALVLITASGYKRIGKIVESSFVGQDFELVFDYFNGECSKNEINRLIAIADDKGCDMVIGIGGNYAFGGNIPFFGMQVPCIAGAAIFGIILNLLLSIGEKKK